MAQQQQDRGGVGPGRTGFLAFQYLLFACLGLCCSYLWNTQFTGTGGSSYIQQLFSTDSRTENHSLDYVRSILKDTDCEELKRRVHVPLEVKNYLGTKLRYQFDEVIKNDMSIGRNGHCIAVKVHCGQWI